MTSERKKNVVTGLTGLLKDYPIVGVIDMQNLPAPQLQQMRKALRGKVEIRMTRRRLLTMAINGTNSGLDKLLPHLGGMPALLFTKENPFSLYKITENNKSSAPAKPGQIAPKDLIVPAGPTPFAPGPVIGELGALGFKTGVEAGKVVIKQDHAVCKKGDVISLKAAEILKRFSIEPMEIGLNIVAVFEKGIIFTSDELKIDEVAFGGRLLEAIGGARNLAVDVTYPAMDVVELLVQKAFREAKAVALEGNIISKDTIDEILGKSEGAALALHEIVPHE